MFITAIAADVVNLGELSEEKWKMFLLWSIHLIMTMIFFLVLDLTRFRKLAPAVLLLLEGITFLVGFSNMRIAQFMYGMWGMYFQSKWYFGETGVSVLLSLLTEMALIALVYLAGRIFLERKI